MIMNVFLTIEIMVFLLSFLGNQYVLFADNLHTSIDIVVMNQNFKTVPQMI